MRWKIRHHWKLFFQTLLIGSVLLCGEHLQGDTTQVATSVGPGVKHHQFTIDSPPLTINCMEVEWPNEHVTLKAVIASDSEKGRRVETVSQMSERYEQKHQQVIGGINGDYFYMEPSGLPTNLHIQDSELATEPINRAVFALTQADSVIIDTFRFEGLVDAGSGKVRKISGYNRARASNELVLYNQYRGASSRTNDWGTEIALTPLNEWQVNDTVFCLVQQKQSNAGDMPIREGNAVLSGHGAGAIFLQHAVEVGDTLALVLKILPDHGAITQAIGGGPRILENGVNISNTGIEDVRSTNQTFYRHPRTAIGFTGDTSRVYLVTVDGRSERSRGMTLSELASFLKHRFRVWHALNLDGGGSTTMVINGEVINNPSDPGGERAVGNALLIVISDAQARKDAEVH